MNVISLSDRRNENAKRRRGDEMRRLCWFLAADSADKKLVEEQLRTVAALDVVVAQIECEEAEKILRMRKPVQFFWHSDEVKTELATHLSHAVVALSGKCKASVQLRGETNFG